MPENGPMSEESTNEIFARLERLERDVNELDDTRLELSDDVGALRMDMQALTEEFDNNLMQTVRDEIEANMGERIMQLTNMVEHAVLELRDAQATAPAYLRELFDEWMHNEGQPGLGAYMAPERGLNEALNGLDQFVVYNDANNQPPAALAGRQYFEGPIQVDEIGPGMVLPTPERDE